MLIYYKKKSVTVLILLLLFSTGTLSAEKKLIPRVLVLGVDSRLINDIQNRLLREIVLRDLSDNGFSIVSVMELEGIISEISESRLRKQKDEGLRKLCKKLNLDFCILGRLTGLNQQKKTSGIIADKSYKFEVTIYSSVHDRYHRKIFTVMGREDYFDLFKSLSKKIIIQFKSIIED